MELIDKVRKWTMIDPMQNSRINRFIPFILSQDMLLYFYEGLMEHNKNHMDQSETFKGVFKQTHYFYLSGRNISYQYKNLNKKFVVKIRPFILTCIFYASNNTKNR